MSRRIRSIKPEWLDDERMAACSLASRVMSVALITLADDYGRGRANLVQLGAHVFPFEPSPPRMAKEAMEELERTQFVRRYEIDGQSYFEIRTWDKHQRVNHPGKPRVPSPCEGSRGSLADSRDSLESSRGSRESLSPDLDQDQDLDLDTEGECEGEPSPEPDRERELRSRSTNWETVGGRVSPRNATREPSAGTDPAREVREPAQEVREPAQEVREPLTAPELESLSDELDPETQFDLWSQPGNAQAEPAQEPSTSTPPATPLAKAGAGSVKAKPATTVPGREVQVVWDIYLRFRSAMCVRGQAPTLTADRASLIRRRISESTLPVVARAAAGIWMDEWSTQQPGRCGPESAFRNVANVERYAAVPQTKNRMIELPEEALGDMPEDFIEQLRKRRDAERPKPRLVVAEAPKSDQSDRRSGPYPLSREELDATFSNERKPRDLYAGWTQEELDVMARLKFGYEGAK